MSTLVIQLPDLPPVAHVLKDDTITIGRMKGNTIVIEDSSISLMHAKITRKNGAFYLKDLNSTNGTTVNGQPITEVRLEYKAKIQFADVPAQFQALEPVVSGQPFSQASAAAPGPSPSKSAPVSRPPTSEAASRREADIRKPAAQPNKSSKSFSFARFMTYFAGVLGGAAALGVIGFIGWRFLHVSGDGSSRTSNSLIGASTVSARQPTNPYPETDASAALAAQTPPTLSASTQAVDQTQVQEESIQQLIKALASPDPDERRRASMALHSRGAASKEATPALKIALKDSEPEVRIWSALTLVNVKCYDKATIPILVEVLQYGNATLRQVACLSLGLFPYEESEKESVVPALAEVAGKDSNDEVRKAAVSSLSVIAPEVVGKISKK